MNEDLLLATSLLAAPTALTLVGFGARGSPAPTYWGIGLGLLAAFGVAVFLLTREGSSATSTMANLLPVCVPEGRPAE
ncbi:MAG: hypothetical protein IPK07_18160 [Deltaproteobacteria bacterium]|jgi:hypothetical protein|nr:hypothetical protein [Deltaproteobacteria bacterium]